MCTSTAGRPAGSAAAVAAGLCAPETLIIGTQTPYMCVAFQSASSICFSQLHGLRLFKLWLLAITKP